MSSRTRTTISFSERGNPRRYTISLGDPASDLHAHMMEAMSGHHVMSRSSASLHSMMGSMPRIEDLFQDLVDRTSEPNAPELIDTIPVYKAEGDVGECSVCQENIKNGEDFRRLPCSDTVNHCFHSKCIDQWLTSNDTCPNCRAKLF